MHKVYATVSELGVLCYAESMASPESVRCLPLIGAKVRPTQSPNSFQITCLEKPGCATQMSYVFQAPDLQASFLWQEALNTAAVQLGSGWLEVRTAFTWKCRWVVVLTVPGQPGRGVSRLSDCSRLSLPLRAGSRWLMWSRSPEDMLVGEICGSVELGSTEASASRLVLLQPWSALASTLKTGLTPAKCLCRSSIATHARTASEWVSLACLCFQLGSQKHARLHFCLDL